jgi:integrase
MPRKQLTDLFIETVRLAPRGKQVDYFDRGLPAFGLRVGSARKSYFVHCRVLLEGAWKSKRFTLGAVEQISLAEARAEAKRILSEARSGQIPESGRKERRGALETRSRNTFAHVRELFLERYVGRGNRRPSESTLRLRRACLCSRDLKRWERLPIDSIGEQQIVEALDAINASGRATMANRVHSSLRILFRWARSRHLIERDPMRDILAPGHEAPRERFLSLEELVGVWKATRPDDLFGGIIRLLILTGQRREEIAQARWDELRKDEEIGEALVLPPGRTKNRRGHIVPLSDPALAIMNARRAEQAATGTDTPFVFCAKKRPFSAWSREKRALDARAGITTPWVTHDLRRTVATHLSEELHIAPHVVEAILNHTSGSKSGVAGIYNRAPYLAERRSALNAWSRFVLELAGEAGTEQKIIAMQR